jgi:hypothetical protein
MHSFITLINEKQLNKYEQRQAFDGIRNDYEHLIRNYEQIRNDDTSVDLPEELNMDV